MQKTLVRHFAVFALAIMSLTVRAQAQDLPEKKNWRVLIEPKFMKPPVSFEIPKAKTVFFVPGYVNADGDPVCFTQAQWDALKMEWDDFFAAARVNAGAALDGLKPEYVRDKKQVITYAVLRSESPLTAAIVFAPGFLKKFEDVFGPQMLVVIPNRHSVFIFPKLASDYQKYGPMILDAYRTNEHKLSLEVFELGAGGIHAVGSYQEP